MSTDWAQRGPLPTRLDMIDAWCTVDGRDVAVAVHHPVSDSGRSAPAVVFCHGLGSGRDEYGVIGRHLASYGIVSIHPEFDDAFAVLRGRLGLQHLTSSTWSADSHARGTVLKLLFDPDQWRSRAHRAGAVIDAIGTHSIPGLTGGPVIAAGHSFGAFTAQMLAGVRLSEPALDGEDFSHPAVAGAALLSPQGSGSRGLTSRSWEGLHLPLLEVTATHDLGPRGEGLAWRSEPFDAAPARHKWLMVARGGDHKLGGIAAPSEPVGSPEVVAGIAGAVAAFATWLGGDTAAGEWLDAGQRSDLFDLTSRRADG